MFLTSYTRYNDVAYGNTSHTWHLFKSQWCSVWKHVAYAAPIQKSMMQRMETCCIRGTSSNVNDAAYGNMLHTWHLFKSQWCSVLVSPSGFHLESIVFARFAAMITSYLSAKTRRSVVSLVRSVNRAESAKRLKRKCLPGNRTWWFRYM